MYIINLETDGDGWYHVHRATCSRGPKSNCKPLRATNIGAAIEEAKSLLQKQNVRKCSYCCY